MQWYWQAVCIYERMCRKIPFYNVNSAACAAFSWFLNSRVLSSMAQLVDTISHSFDPKKGQHHVIEMRTLYDLSNYIRQIWKIPIRYSQV